MKVKLTRKTWCIFGYKESGKSILAKVLASKYKEKCLYYDTLHECPTAASFHSYPPQNKQSIDELEVIINLIKQNKRYRMFIIDEANRFARAKPSVLPQTIADLNDWCRHPQYNLSVGYIARRPVTLNTDLTEIADYLFIFQLGGVNDIKYLNQMRAGLGDTVMALAQYHFVMVRPNRSWEVMSPVTPDKLFIGSDTRPLTANP